MSFFLRLQQTAQSDAVVLLLVALLVSVRAKLTSSGQPFQQRQLFAAVQASHMFVIGVDRRFVKAISGSFYTVKLLSSLSQASSL